MAKFMNSDTFIFDVLFILQDQYDVLWFMRRRVLGWLILWYRMTLWHVEMSKIQ